MICDAVKYSRIIDYSQYSFYIVLSFLSKSCEKNKQQIAVGTLHRLIAETVVHGDSLSRNTRYFLTRPDLTKKLERTAIAIGKW